MGYPLYEGLMPGGDNKNGMLKRGNRVFSLSTNSRFILPLAPFPIHQDFQDHAAFTNSMGLLATPERVQNQEPGMQDYLR